MPIKAIKPTDAGTDRYSPVIASATTPAYQCKRNIDEYQQRLPYAVQRAKQQQENQRQRHRHDQRQSCCGALLIFQTARPSSGDIRREV